MSATLPFELLLTQQAFGQSPYAAGTPRRLSDIKDSFGDDAAVAAALQIDNPIIYDFHALRSIEAGQKLIFGVTTIYPGTVGGEYYMTKGHFHAREHDGDEVYMVVKGNGYLLLQARDGSPQTLEMYPGAVYYTPATWAHRTVNSGAEELVFFSIWAADVQYDYETITRRGGFPQRIVQRDGIPVVVENAKFHLD